MTATVAAVATIAAIAGVQFGAVFRLIWLEKHGQHRPRAVRSRRVAMQLHAPARLRTWH